MQFLVKNADVSKTQGVSHVIYIPLGSSLVKVRYNWELLSPPPPKRSGKKAHLNRVKFTFCHNIFTTKRKVISVMH